MAPSSGASSMAVPPPLPPVSTTIGEYPSWTATIRPGPLHDPSCTCHRRARPGWSPDQAMRTICLSTTAIPLGERGPDGPVSRAVTPLSVGIRRSLCSVMACACCAEATVVAPDHAATRMDRRRYREVTVSWSGFGVRAQESPSARLEGRRQGRLRSLVRRLAVRVPPCHSSGAPSSPPRTVRTHAGIRSVPAHRVRCR